MGPKLADRLRRLGIATVEDVLLHLPLRYQDRTRVTPINQLQPGDEAQIEAEVVGSEVTARGRRFLLCHLADGAGVLTLRFFHFSPAQEQLFSRPGARLRCFGEVRQGYAGLEMIHPECRRIGPDAPPVDDRLTPVYPATAGLQQFTLRGLAEQALAQLEAAGLLPELLPAELRAQLQLPPIAEAVELLHRPPADDGAGGRWRAAAIRPGGGWRSRNCWRISSACAGCGRGFNARPRRRWPVTAD